MQDEPRYSIFTVYTYTAWLSTALLAVAAWGVWVLHGSPFLAILIAETACIASAVAAVLQIRCFGSRIARMIRLQTLAREAEAGEVRHLR